METRSSGRQPRYRRFRLQTLLVLVTVYGVVMGLVVRELQREQQRKHLAVELRRAGGHVHLKQPYPGEAKATGIINGWLRVFLGDDYFTEASYIALKPQSAEDLELLRNFPEVTSLRLDGSVITDLGLERLTGLTQLKSLELQNTVVTPRVLQSLAKLSTVQFLNLQKCSLPEESVPSLTAFPDLRSLNFNQCSLSEQFLRSLTRIPNLRSLSFPDGSLDDASLRFLYGSCSPVELQLASLHVTEAGMLALRDANPAWSIRFTDKSSIQSPGVANANYFPSIQGMPHVTELAYQGSLTSDSTLRILKDAVRLTRLRLWKCRVTDEGLQNLRSLQSLASLDIGDIPITDEGVRALQDLKQLTILRLTGTKIEGIGLGSLPPTIKVLSFSDSSVTDRDVANIAKMTSLEELHLGNTRITDEGISELVKLTSLRSLSLLQADISDAGVVRLQQALPNCQIAHLPRPSGPK